MRRDETNCQKRGETSQANPLFQFTNKTSRGRFWSVCGWLDVSNTNDSLRVSNNSVLWCRPHLLYILPLSQHRFLSLVISGMIFLCMRLANLVYGWSAGWLLTEFVILCFNFCVIVRTRESPKQTRNILQFPYETREITSFLCEENSIAYLHFCTYEPFLITQSPISLSTWITWPNYYPHN
jgi:hypothetical protein